MNEVRFSCCSFEYYLDENGKPVVVDEESEYQEASMKALQEHEAKGKLKSVKTA